MSSYVSTHVYMYTMHIYIYNTGTYIYSTMLLFIKKGYKMLIVSMEYSFVFIFFPVDQPFTWHLNCSEVAL